MPRDRFGGGKLLYKLTKSGYVLYSVGANGKDDGGTKGDSFDEGDIVIRAER